MKDIWRCSSCGGVFHALTPCPVRHYISGEKFTVEVEVNAHGIITRAAPITRKFVGQR
jgi:rubredoxin